MLKSIENSVHIEGVLSEIDLKYGSLKRDTGDMKTVGGTIKIRVETIINGEETTLEVPVRMFATQYTNAGKPNPGYEAIERVMTEYTSIAASNYDVADRVRITGGELTMNEYYNQNGAFVSFPAVKATYVTRISRQDCKPAADFALVFMVSNKGFETDRDGVETNRYRIQAIVPQYGEKVDVIPLYALSAQAIDVAQSYWNEGDTVKIVGRLNFSSKTETVETKVDFGEPIKKTRTVSVSELIITGGNSAPLEGDFAFNFDEVRAALDKRKDYLAALKDKAANKNATHKVAAPAQNSTSKFRDLGF